MDDFLNKEPVKRVQEFITKFDSKLKVMVLSTTARTAKEAAISLECEVGAIVKSLVFRADNTFLICLLAKTNTNCFLRAWCHNKHWRKKRIIGFAK